MSDDTKPTKETAAPKAEAPTPAPSPLDGLDLSRTKTKELDLRAFTVPATCW